MREHAGQILKAVCYVLAALLLYQLVQLGLRMNPLSHVTIPPLPRLASDINAPDGGKGMTNATQTSTAKGTNAASKDSGTNSVAAKAKKENETSAVSGDLAKAGATNSVGPLTPARSASTGAGKNGSQPTNDSPDTTNTPTLTKESETTKPDTNSPMLTAVPTAAVSATNLPAGTLTNDQSSVSGTNIPTVALSTNGTNVPPVTTMTGTNILPAAVGTNSAARKKSKGTNSAAPSAMAMGGMDPSAMMHGGGKPAELPPEIKARVDRIYESELFGQIMHPMPMGLLGIAGNSAFLRAPSGQTGLVKEGDSLGEIKLLRIGINRVLVEQDGKKTELMIFDGYGGETLMPKDKETSK